MKSILSAGRVFLIFFLIFSSILLGEKFTKKYTGNLYYLPSRNFWDIYKHTNIFGQWNNAEEIVLELPGWQQKVKFKKPQSVVRVVCLGTSSTAGWENEKKNAYPTILQKKLDSSYGHGKYEVINAGRGAYVSFQLFIFFKDLLLELSPDIVILYMGSNDTGYRAGITARGYYEKLKKIIPKLKENRRKYRKLIKYGLPGLVPFYPILAESRILGYFYFKLLDFAKRKKYLNKSTFVLLRIRNMF